MSRTALPRRDAAGSHISPKVPGWLAVPRVFHDKGNYLESDREKYTLLGGLVTTRLGCEGARRSRSPETANVASGRTRQESAGRLSARAASGFRSSRSDIPPERFPGEAIYFLAGVEFAEADPADSDDR